MNPFSVVAGALISLGKNKVRTALSMLCIVTGVPSAPAPQSALLVMCWVSWDS